MGERREEILADLLGERPRLLRAELAPGDRGGAERPRAVHLAFDVGGLLIEAAPGGVRLAVGAVELEDAEPAEERDPWWTVIGNELAGAWALSGEGHEQTGIELQFRRDEDRPKLVTLRLEGDALEVRARHKTESLH